MAAVTFGLVHGGLDYLLPAWSSGSETTAASAALVAVAYAGAAGVSVAALALAPNLAVELLLAVSAYHFASSDRAVLKWRRGRPIPR